MPLLEIVSEPEIRSSEEDQYLHEIRKLVRYLEISNGNMEEGSLRCDANISVRPLGEVELRNRVEVKNINSLKNVMKAIDLEAARQIQCYENNQIVDQETRNYNAANNTTTILRSKEDAHDYRYFPEPDIPPLIISESFISDIKSTMPKLPKDRIQQYKNEFRLSDYDAKILTDEKGLSDLFEIIQYSKSYKTIANLIMGVVKSYLNEDSISVNSLNIDPKFIAELASMIDQNQISHIVISQKLFPELAKENISPMKIAKKNGWLQEDDTQLIEKYISDVMVEYPDKVEAYKNGKTNLIGLFMGEIMKKTKGKFNPKLINKLLQTKLMK